MTSLSWLSEERKHERRAVVTLNPDPTRWSDLAHLAVSWLTNDATDIMLGKTISHYRILEKLGEGGMGVVYKAEDTKLERMVALKFPPKDLWCDEEARARFIHEARAASALNHPNITTIHEIDEVKGQCFIAMEYIEGKSLKRLLGEKTLSLNEILEIAIQIAEGLNAAHKKGIVHRDIKPDNVMITDDGLAKIMDFGLAKLKGVSGLTKAGTTVGTVLYMSPEQARGDAVDHRTDIWSLGVVLYEMCTGKSPFKAEYEQAVMYSILNSTPKPMASARAEMPKELEKTVDRALAKSPDSRYQNVADMLAELETLARAIESVASRGKLSANKAQTSVAVLPFVNLSADKEQEYFCDGIAEEIINALTHVEGLRIVARTSAFAFKGKSEDVREIGRRLDVKAVLEGSVRKAGNRLRITVQLVDVADGYHIWSERYDREMEDVFAIQDEISLAVVEKLKVRLLGEEKAAIVKRSTENLEAYSLYLKGRYHWNKRALDGVRKSIELFEQAIEKDPNYALAYAGLADGYNILGGFGVSPPSDCFPKADAAALKALGLDSALAEAHTSLAYVYANYKWNWAGAEREYRRAIELNPGYATARQWYALYLSAMGRHDEAFEQVKLALELDPLSLIINLARARVLDYARRYEEAIEQCHRVLEMDQNFAAAHYSLGSVYLRLKRYKEGMNELRWGSELFAGNPMFAGILGYTYALMGKRAEALKILDDLKNMSRKQYVPAFMIASVYIGLDDKDQAFEWLEKAFQERDPDLILLKVEPLYDGLRSDPPFVALLKKMELEA
jgi:serine/threonine protein kinase/Flp pilus assembly protein TadD